MCLFLIIFSDGSNQSSPQCGYQSCPGTEPDMLNVHLVAHSHDDVGWLKTVDQYFQGSNRKGWVGWEENQRAGVQYTIDTVVEELAMDPEKKYIQVETAFFWRWWKQQDEDVREIVRALVNQNQLEFIGGGWSMNDEGASHYAAIVDQMSLGLRRLNDTFGACGVPKVAWQIDPFGHSKEQASLFANMGFDGLFFARLDWRDKTQREHNKTLEMVWEASQDLGAQSDLFTGVLFDHYGPPPGFCWDLLCNDEPIMDSPILENNLDDRIKVFVDYVRNQGEHYKTNNIMLTMGMDFHYQAAHAWFMNLDRLIKHVNDQDLGIKIFYSTPSCYLKAVHSSGESWPTKQDDFFPYASDPHAYWSGYFSSRPTSKYMIRQTERMAKILSQLALVTEAIEDTEDVDKMNVLYETVGIVQHHDAVTGTEKQHVANDYHTRMHHALETGSGVVNLTPVYTVDHLGGPTICPLLNTSQCPTTELFEDELQVNIYNPLARTRTYYARLPVIFASYQVQTQQGDDIPSQLVPIPEQVLSLPGRESQATHVLVFKTTTDPMSISQYFIKKTLLNKKTIKSQSLKERKLKKFVAGKNGLKMYVEHKNPTVYFKHEAKEVDLEVKMELLYYKGHRGNNSEFEFRASGAYIFRPDGDQAEPFGDPLDTLVTEGPVVDEVHRTYSDNWVTQVIRLYHDEQLVEVEWVVGPVPVDDGVGKEVIARYSTSINNEGIFFTDANGRQMMERELNYRPTYEINMTEPVAQNYYPVNCKILIADDVNQLGVLTDRSQGGASILEGSVELMLHRRLLDDDAFGVGEALNEKAFGKGLVAVGKHSIILDRNAEQFSKKHRLQAMDLFYQPLEIFGEISPLNFPSSPVLTGALPENLHILTMQRILIQEESFLFLQLEHIFQAGEHPQLSLPVTVSLSDMFSLFSVEWARETTLGGNAWRDEVERLVFMKDSNNIPQAVNYKHNQVDFDLVVTLGPMEIRSFVMKVAFREK